MDRIRTLYSSMDRSERKSLKAYLKLFGTAKGMEKPFKLLKMLEKNPDFSQDQASRDLYQKAGSKAFIMMKGRLYERMAEFHILSLNPSLEKRDKNHPYFKDLFAYRKNMLQATVYQEKRLGTLAMYHFKMALKQAKSCANAELETDVLVRIRGNFHFQDMEFDQLTEDLNSANQRSETEIFALTLHHSFFQGHYLRSGSESEKVAFLEEKLPDLEKMLAQYDSVRARYYLLVLRTNLFRLRGELQPAKTTALAGIDLLLQNPGIRSRQRHAEFYTQLGLVELQSLSFTASIDALTSARSFLKPVSISFFVLSNLLLYPLLYEGQLDEARDELEQLEELRQLPRFQKSHGLLGMHRFFQACLQFREERFREAWLSLQKIDELQFDKEGWDTGMRIFEIVVLVECGEQEFAESKVDTLRKHIGRYRPNSRESAILDLIRRQSRQFFSFEEFNGEMQLLEAIESIPWDPVGHEVIKIDDWYREKRAQYS